MVISDGIIDVDSEAGKALGFTSDKFTHSSYLGKEGNVMWISAIRSVQPGKGHFSALLETLEKEGLDIFVATVTPKLESILKAKGFKFEIVYSAEAMEDLEVWIKRQKKEE